MLVVVVAGLLCGCERGSPRPVAPSGAAAAREAAPLVDLDGHPVSPWREQPARVTLFIFTRIDCPIANRYARDTTAV